MTAGVDNHRYTLAELEAVATIPPVSTNGGRRRRMGCPFHGSDHQRSLEVDLETGRFSCHNCGAWGYLSDHPGGNRPGRDRREPGRADKASPRPGAYNGFRRPPEARTAPERPTAVLQAPVSPSGQPGQGPKRWPGTWRPPGPTWRTRRPWPTWRRVISPWRWPGSMGLVTSRPASGRESGND